MRVPKIIAALLALSMLTQCRFVTILMPDRIAAGESFTAEVQLKADAGVTNASTPVGCVTLPLGWSVSSVSWSGTVAGSPISGTASFDQVESDFVAAEFPRADRTWSCWVSDLGDYAGGDLGTALFEMVGGDTAGRFPIWFAAGRLEFNNANQYAIALHTVAVDQPAEPLDVWSESTPPVPNGSFYDVAWGPEGWIAVGNDAHQATSSDGKTWALTTFGGNDDWHGIAANDDRYVIVSATGFRHSENGLNWTDATGPTSANAIAYGGGRFVAVGDAGTLHRSADGLAWNTSDDVSWGKLTDVDYDEVTGTWIAVGYGGFTKSTTVLTSPDGIVFTPGGFNGPELDEAGAGGGLFVVSGGDATSFHWWTSTDGTNFTEMLPNPGQVLYDGIDADGVFVGVGRQGNIWTADSGGTVELRAARTSEIMRGVAYHSGRIIAVGDGGHIYQASIAPEPDVQDACALPEATVGEAYSATLTYDPGFGAHTWDTTGAPVPAGLVLADATLSGEPTASGDFAFGVTVTDEKGDSDSTSCTLTVLAGDDTGDADDTGDTNDTDDTLDTTSTAVGGCGCTAGGPAQGMLMLPLLLLGLRRRR